MNEILIGADFVPTKNNEELFANGDVEGLFGMELNHILERAGFRIFNLETPLCDSEHPIDKIGPNLIAPSRTIHGFVKAGVNFVTLSNNHILDQGAEGLQATMELLDQKGINHAGAGKNLSEAAEPYVFSYQGKAVGIYCCAEHEFTIASNDRPGANPFEPLYSLDHVYALKQKCDYVIVLYHGGKEHYRYPSPRLREVCHAFVNKGADLVICQHTHCIGCEEKYRDSVIVYGQGNFLFAGQDDEYWNTSLLVCLEYDQSKWRVSYLPLRKVGSAVRLAKDSEAAEILNGFWKRSEEIKSESFIEQRYAEFARTQLNFYLNYIGGRESFVFKVLNRLSNRWLRKWRLSRRYDKYHLLCIRNFTECEAHRELLDAGCVGHCRC